MIKYKIQLGYKHLNMEARLHRDGMEETLKGMHCRKCPGVDTVISFKEQTVNGQLSTTVVNFIVPVVSACCEDFERRLLEALKK